ncbi:tetratricopeptide repeat protein [Aureivirga sp. CE67]|uniref:tetratricopeptide repeat protein n=1 Tax=Aureivirga sp. CE67 TaxID=1788983 RepID=UPI0018CB4CED|nr:tetratricopeptide repeat protein [Aureivirga sp. CE67]
MKRILFNTVFLLFTVLSFSQSLTAEEYVELAGKELKKNDPFAAVAKLNEGINVHSKNPILYESRGVIYDALTLFDKALEDFDTALNLTENIKYKSILYSNRGATKYKIRDFQGSYKDVKKAIELDKNNLDALNNLASVCDEVGKPEETIVYLKKILEIQPKYTAAYVNLGFKYQTMGKHKEAINYFNQAISLDPNEPFAYSNRSFSKLQTKDLDGAMQDILKSLTIYDANSYAYKIRALILIEQKKYETACDDLNTASKLGYTNQYGSEVDELKEKYCK